MSLALICLCLILSPTVHDRAYFRQALRDLPPDASKATVERLFGKPDDIWSASDSPLYSNSGEETWCYGTNGHHTFPTLGRIVFYEGTIRRAIGAYLARPAQALMAEKDRKRYLRLMYRRPRSTFDRGSDPLRLIQVANLLRPLGKEKAIWLMSEFESLSDENQSLWLFWLVRVLFISSAPRGIFAVPEIGQITPKPPADLARWPTYPLIIVDDFPVVIFRGITLYGAAEQFQMYADRSQKDWTIRAQRISPPNDPFLTLEKIFQSANWPVTNLDAEEFEQTKNLLAVLSTVYSEKESGGPFRVWSPKAFEQLHRSYLKLGGHWDDNRQMYVRRNGSFTPDKEVLHFQHIFDFPKLPGLSLNLAACKQDVENVVVECKFSETAPRVSNAVIVLVDVTTGKERAWRQLNGDSFSNSQQPSSYRNILTAPPHAKMDGIASTDLDAELPPRHKVKLLIKIGHKTYSTPTFIP